MFSIIIIIENQEVQGRNPEGLLLRTQLGAI